MAKARTYYDILQVSPDADPEVIASAYRTIMATLKKHPDLGGDTEKAQLINEAHETLSDTARRARYDAGIPTRKTADAAKREGIVERRRVPRHQVDATVSYCLDHDLRWHPARVKDASTLGVRILSHAPIRTGQHIVISPANLAAYAIHGTVCWTRMFHPTIFERVYEAGIEFSDQITDIDQRLSPY